MAVLDSRWSRYVTKCGPIKFFFLVSWDMWSTPCFVAVLRRATSLCFDIGPFTFGCEVTWPW